MRQKKCKALRKKAWIEYNSSREGFMQSFKALFRKVKRGIIKV